MKMTKKLADQLMETLMCVALSATGGVDPNNLNEEQLECAEDYAKNTFCELLEAWEELLGEEWEIEKGEEN